MIPYLDRNGDSGVRAFEIGSDYIRVQFKTGRLYLYSYASAGSGNIEQMKRLARNGAGLNGFINSNVRNKFVR